MTKDDKDRLTSICIVWPMVDIIDVLDAVCNDCATDKDNYTAHERARYRTLRTKLKRAADYAGKHQL